MRDTTDSEADRAWFVTVMRRYDRVEVDEDVRDTRRSLQRLRLLTTGRVDPRLMIVLSVLAGSHTLTVSDFPTAPYEPADALRRQVLLASVDGLPATGPAVLRSWLDGQHAPFVPAVVRVQDGGLLIGYRAPTPPGLLPE